MLAAVLEGQQQLIIVCRDDGTVDFVVTRDTDGTQVKRVFVSEASVGPVVNLTGAGLVANLAPSLASL